MCVVIVIQVKRGKVEQGSGDMKIADLKLIKGLDQHNTYKFLGGTFEKRAPESCLFYECYDNAAIATYVCLMLHFVYAYSTSDLSEIKHWLRDFTVDHALDALMIIET